MSRNSVVETTIGVAITNNINSSNSFIVSTSVGLISTKTLSYNKDMAFIYLLLVISCLQYQVAATLQQGNYFEVNTVVHYDNRGVIVQSYVIYGRKHSLLREP